MTTTSQAALVAASTKLEIARRLLSEVMIDVDGSAELRSALPSNFARGSLIDLIREVDVVTGSVHRALKDGKL